MTPAVRIDVLTGRVWYDRPPLSAERPHGSYGSSSSAPRPPRVVHCQRCPATFEARQGGARYCPSCRTVVRRETYRRRAERRKAKECAA